MKHSFLDDGLVSIRTTEIFLVFMCVMFSRLNMDGIATEIVDHKVVRIEWMQKIFQKVFTLETNRRLVLIIQDGGWSDNMDRRCAAAAAHFCLEIVVQQVAFCFIFKYKILCF